MKKVLFFVSPYFGGASRMTVTIGTMLDKSEYDVKFVVFGKEICEIVNFIPQGYPVLFLKIRNIWDFTVLKLIKLFREERPSHVFASFQYFNIRVVIAAKIVGNIKIVLRNNNGLTGLRLDNKILLKLVYPYSDYIITQQEEMTEELVRFLPSMKSKIVQLHNYMDRKVVDNNLQYPSPYMNPKGVIFVCAARVTKIKGQDVLLKAFSIIKRDLPDASLYLLGRYEVEDSFYKSLCEYIKANNLADSVHFEGLIPNPHIYIKYANCFVLPSYNEGLPNALIETLYIGTPVVVTSCIPVIKRMVDEGKNGYIVKPGDHLAMAYAMKKAILLKNCHSTYHSSTKDDYVELFR